MSVSTPVRSSPTFAPSLTALTPRLIGRGAVAGGAHLWNSPQFSTSTAYISLSPALACVLVDASGNALSHQRIGEIGCSVNEAWNRAADNVLGAALRDGEVEFWVRGARAVLGARAPRGFELKCDALPPASWLAHPKLFSVLDNHFTQLLRPRFGLTYVTRDFRDLFVFDTLAREFAAAYTQSHVVRYSVGFPVLERR